MGSGDQKDIRSPGEILRESRHVRELSVEDVAEATKISPRMLVALEADEYDELASPLYARSFLRNLARFFGLDEAELFERLESFDPEASRPQIPVNIESGEDAPIVAIPTPATANPVPEAPATWRVETVDSTQVKHIRVTGGRGFGRNLLVVLLVVVLAVAAWFVWRGTGGGDSDGDQNSDLDVGQRNLAANKAPESPLTESLQLAGPVVDAEDEEPIKDPAEELTPTTQPAAQNGSSEAAEFEVVVPELTSPAQDRERVVVELAGPSGNREDPTQAPTPSAGEGDATSQDAANENAGADNEEQAPANSTQDDPREAQEPATQDGPPATVAGDADEAGGAGLASIVRPGMQPPVAGEAVLELRALRRAELWVSADGEGRQRRTLAVGEVLRITARDHFSLELTDPDAVEVRVDGELREVPTGLESEWVIYPR